MSNNQNDQNNHGALHKEVPVHVQGVTPQEALQNLIQGAFDGTVSQVQALEAELAPFEKEDIINQAAEKAGVPADEMTLQQALLSIMRFDIEGATPLLDKIAESFAKDILDNMTPDQWEQLKKSADDAETLERVKKSIADAIQVPDAIHNITIETPPPYLNPNSPEFDAAAYSKKIAEMGGWNEAGKRITQAFQNAMPQRVYQKFTEAASQIAQFVQSDQYQALKENVATMEAAQEAIEVELPEDAPEELRDIAPFLQAEFEQAAEADKRLAEFTLLEVWQMGLDGNGKPLDNVCGQLISAARKKKADLEAGKEVIEETERKVKEIARVTAINTGILDYPLDKPNGYIWSLLESAEGNGQIQMDFDTRKKGKGNKKGNSTAQMVLYSIDFSELTENEQLKITKKLTPYDERVYLAAAALFNAGNEIITATQIYTAMGYTGKPRARKSKTGTETDDLQKINDSLTKMGKAHITIDNTREVNSGMKYPQFKYDAPLLPFERVQAYVNGKLTESAIHLFREPPLITFARGRDQITTITRELLESPISKTEAHLAIEHYLYERIGHMKNPKSKKLPRKILFDTLYERCHFTDKKQKQRAAETVRILLDHYKNHKWIKDFTEEADGVTIKL